VLITRARRRCVVFTNLTADDLDLKRRRRRGDPGFKSFLAFAKGGPSRADVEGAEAAGGRGVREPGDGRR
jgi:hypothetical protein